MNTPETTPDSPSRFETPLPPPTPESLRPAGSDDGVSRDSGSRLVGDQPSGSVARLAVGTVGNVLWLILAGIWLCAAYVIAGILAMVTVVGIPFGVQAFKLAGYALWPFNRMVVVDRRRDAGLSLLGNVAWFLVGGWWLALAHVVFGFLLIFTIVGAPLGLASFKMAGLALAPFGKRIVTRSQALTPDVIVVSSIG